MLSIDKIIGYDDVKLELCKLADIIKNPGAYAALGARMPSGLLLYGEPGVGKTFMSQTFIEECGVYSRTVRHNCDSGTLIKEIKSAFSDAATNAPSIVFLDDMDKFASSNNDSEEFAVIQSAIDEVKGIGVFVIATINSKRRIPSSLLRAGRFDVEIEIKAPENEDATKIISHYMKRKAFIEKLDYDDVGKLLSGHSCAELETIINAAAISAGFERRKVVNMDDIVSASLKEAYGINNGCTITSKKNLEYTAYHEAGHALVAEVLEGRSVGFVSLSSDGSSSVGGFMKLCTSIRSPAERALVALGGKAACEHHYGYAATGTKSDLSMALSYLTDLIEGTATHGTAFLPSCFPDADSGAGLNARQSVQQAELQRHIFIAQRIVAENSEFLERLAMGLLKKGYLLASDIAEIRASCTVNPISLI